MKPKLTPKIKIRPLTSPPPYTMTFSDEKNNEVGKLIWENGIMRFEGHVEKSAHIFMEYLCKIMNIPVSKRGDK